MTIELGLKGAGGSSLNTTEAFNRFNDLYTDEDGKVWIITGTIETDVGSYPNAYSYVLGSYTGVTFSTPEAVSPRGIAWDGTFFWVLNNANVVFRYTAAGAYDSFSFPVTGLSNALDVVWDGTHLVFIQSNTAVKFLPNGSAVGGGVAIVGSSITWDGTFYWLLTSNTLAQYDSSLVITSVTLPLVDTPSVVAIEWDGTHFWVSSTTEMNQYTSSGEFTGSFVTTSAEGGNVDSLVWDGTNMVTIEETVGAAFKYDITSDRYVGYPTRSVQSSSNFPLYIRIK